MGKTNNTSQIKPDTYFYIIHMNKYVYLLLIFINFIPLGPLAAETYTYLEKGDKYHNSFNNAKALSYYQKAFDTDPNSFEIIKKLTITANDCGEDQVEIDEDKAKEYFFQSVKYAELARKNFPDEDDIYLLLGLSYGNSSRYASGKDKVRLARDVENNFSKMLELRPDYAPPYIGLGIYYREVANLNFLLKFMVKKILGGLPDGSLEDSKEMLIKAVELAPDKVFTHYELAITYLDLEENEKVIYHLQKVLELPSTDHLDSIKKKTATKILKDLQS